jgi:UDP-N-acetylmuramate dehydrogenase
MDIQKTVVLAPYTSFGVGGKAENFVEVSNSEELIQVLKTTNISPIHMISYGSNTLISDQTLPGLVVCIRGGNIIFENSGVTVDSGVWWDDVVVKSIENGLWGIELMSEIPGSVGGGIFINITAYGQSLGPLVDWIDVWDPKSQKVVRIEKSDLLWDYKQSIFQKPENQEIVILRAHVSLRSEMTEELEYQKAIDVAVELNLNPNLLIDRRTIIIEARKRAGSLWHPGSAESKTAGSFFRNPVVDERLAEEIMSYDETNKTAEEIKNMNFVHGGSTKRVSAAHVMLASGFKRGQQWGNVKLNDLNLLKIEALPGASSQEIYGAAKLIQKTCFDKLGINLEFEAQLLGKFE